MDDNISNSDREGDKEDGGEVGVLGEQQLFAKELEVHNGPVYSKVWLMVASDNALQAEWR